MAVLQLHPRDFSAWQAKLGPDAHILLIEVREAWELETAAIAPRADIDFLHVSLGEFVAKLEHIKAQTRDDSHIVCLCHHGVRSMRAAQFLAAQGFDQVVNIEGGIDAWATALEPSVARY